MNSLFLTKMTSDRVEYGVTLLTGSKCDDYDRYVENMEKTKVFETEEEAKHCFKNLAHITKNRPYAALKQFNQYGKSRRTILPLSKCVGHTNRIRHRIKHSDGTYSYWHATLVGEKIVRANENNTHIYSTLGEFVTHHYKSEHPTRKCGKGWDECETKIFGEWVKMAVMREIRA